MFATQLIAQATNHLNRKYSAGREQQLLAAGIPAADKSALADWIKMATRANEAEIAASGNAVFHACTARVSNGVDADLPTLHGVGCRISFVPLAAEILSGEETTDEEAWDNSPDEFGDVRWVIRWGNCGTGFMEPVFLSAPATATSKEIVQQHRELMLKRDDCFATRDAAEAAVVKMLENRCRK